jgi:hypothetical protein
VKKAKLIKRRHFEVHGYYHEIVTKKRRADEHGNSMERFLAHIVDKEVNHTFTDAMDYILTCLKNTRTDKIGYKLALSNALDHFSANTIVEAFTVDFEKDPYFVGETSLSTIPLTPKLAFISGFCDFFLDKVTLA